MNLREQMDQLVQDASTLVQQYANTGDPHWQTCHKLADKYDLYDHEDHIPEWLCFVVQGVMRDEGGES